jgi:hypothetical protein
VQRPEDNTNCDTQVSCLVGIFLSIVNLTRSSKELADDSDAVESIPHEGNRHYQALAYFADDDRRHRCINAESTGQYTMR